MNHESRRGLRLILTVLHLLVQIIMIWLIVSSLNSEEARAPDELLQTMMSMIAYLSVMFGSFFIYYTVIKLITKRNMSRSKSDQLN
ncbi:MAG: hypothetical protein P9X24_03840 [Candidatus Hatepunaea meridiana]|nr:hypothetical protein [Candidatus Hatepunaea meridiana]